GSITACALTNIHVGTAALGCPAERSSAVDLHRRTVELRSTGQPRAAVPTQTVVGSAKKLCLKRPQCLREDSQPPYAATNWLPKASHSATAGCILPTQIRAFLIN